MNDLLINVPRSVMIAGTGHVDDTYKHIYVNPSHIRKIVIA